MKNRALEYIQRHEDKKRYFHSSGYAEAANGENIGANSQGLSLAERRAIDAKRKAVQKYNNSQIMRSFFGAEKARKEILRPKRKAKYNEEIEGGTERYIRGKSLADANAQDERNMATRQKDQRRESLGQRRQQLDKGSIVSPQIKPSNSTLPWQK